MRRFHFAWVACAILLLSMPLKTLASDVIDLGIEKTDLYSGGSVTTDFVTIKPISLVVTVKNYSSIAIDGFTLVPKIDTYYNGTLLGPASGAFYFQPNYINNAAYTPLSINLNGTFQFRADITQPKAGHYRCEISFTTGGSIANMDSNSANNRKTIEFDVSQVEPPKPDLAIENFQISPTGDTFQVSYTVRNTGTDPAQSPFDMKAKIFVIKDPTTIMTREDVFRPHSQPLAPGASVQMGPYVIRDSRAPGAGLGNGTYRVGVYTTQGCNYDTNVGNNRAEVNYNFTGGSAPAGPTVIDLGIEKTDLYSGGSVTTDFVTIKPITLVVTVKNYSSIALDGFTLVPKIDTYYNGTLLGPANGAFYFQPNYINNAASTPLSINLNGTFQFSADMTQPKAGHYRCEISFTTGGSIGSQDSNSVNNRKTLEFDVRQVESPKPDLAIENFSVTKAGDTFTIAYAVRNAGIDPAQSPFDMKAKIFVIKGPTKIMTREDVFRAHNQPLAPNASIPMGPFVIRDSRSPSAGLPDGLYRVGVYITQGCNGDTNISNNRVDVDYTFLQGSGDYAIDGVPETSRAGSTVPVSYRCSIAQSDLRMGFFSVNETGVNPKLGWQAAPGTSGTLPFKMPNQSGRFQFKLYTPNGQILAASSAFSVVMNSAAIPPFGKRVSSPVVMPRTIDKGALTSARRLIEPGPVKTSPKAAVLESRPKKVSLVRKRSSANGTLGGDDPIIDEDCAKDLAFSTIDGYSIADCTKNKGETVILLDENPTSERNITCEGDVTTIRYEWPEEGGDPPGETQIKRLYKNEAKAIGARVLADRPHYTAFELTDSGRKTRITIGIFNGGQKIICTSVKSGDVKQ